MFQCGRRPGGSLGSGAPTPAHRGTRQWVRHPPLRASNVPAVTPLPPLQPPPPPTPSSTDPDFNYGALVPPCSRAGPVSPQPSPAPPQLQDLKGARRGGGGPLRALPRAPSPPPHPGQPVREDSHRAPTLQAEERRRQRCWEIRVVLLL